VEAFFPWPSVSHLIVLRALPELPSDENVKSIVNVSIVIPKSQQVFKIVC